MLKLCKAQQIKKKQESKIYKNCSTTVLTLVSIHSCSIELHNRMNESKHQTQCRTNIAFNLFPKGVINDMLYIIKPLGIDKKLK